MGLFNLQSRYLWLFVLLFAIGATSSFDLTLIARVPVSELIAFAALPFVLRGVPFARFSHHIWPVIAVLALWALGVLVSDSVNGFSMGRFIRGFAKPVWCLLWMLFFIGVLHKDFRALLFYPAGTLVASIQNYFVPQDWTADRIAAGGYDAVAYGIAPIVTMTCLTAAVALYRKGRWFAIIFFAISTVVLAIVGAPRSSIGVMFLNSLIIFYIWWTRRRGGKVFRLNLKRVLLLGCLALLASALIYEGYVASARAGWLGEMQQAKLIGQSDTVFGDSILGLILDGRTAVFGAVLAIMDRPLIGYGSWSGLSLTHYYYDAVAYVGTSAAELSLIAEGIFGLAPGHSILFGGWMENGILTAVALLVIGYWLLKEILLIVQRDSRLAPLLIYFGTSFAWAFFFSPFGVSTRLVIGLFLAFHVMKFHALQAPQNAPEGISPRPRV